MCHIEQTVERFGDNTELLCYFLNAEAKLWESVTYESEAGRIRCAGYAHDARLALVESGC